MMASSFVGLLVAGLKLVESFVPGVVIVADVLVVTLVMVTVVLVALILVAGVVPAVGIVVGDLQNI